ncbi:MAG: hypothetical protein ACI9OJ_004928 [Myxococcota bacterium]
MFEEFPDSVTKFPFAFSGLRQKCSSLSNQSDSQRTTVKASHGGNDQGGMAKTSLTLLDGER